MSAAVANHKKLIVDNGKESHPRAFIMIIDDEAYNCEVLKAMILSMGVDPSRLIVCLGGKQALERASDVRQTGGVIKLVLTDLSMPTMNGYKFIRKFRKQESGDRQGQGAIIAAITGHAESEFFLKALAKGANHAYSKPVSSSSI